VEIAPDLAYRHLLIVNVVFFGPPGAGDRGWTLIDAGIPGSKEFIISAANERFGKDARPAAIVLTHGHFDHVGVLKELAEQWETPIYAHPRERPFLNGSESYPPPSPNVGGGLMARLSPFYPRGPINVDSHLVTLPVDGSVPTMPGWRWLSTPGHSPGHVSLWRERDRSLIAGDAFVTTHQESMYAALAEKPEVHGPPRYFTPDWAAAELSVKKLAELEPDLVITGHGPPMQGKELRHALHALAAHFRQVAVPPTHSA
jgi:glyoxylase-like metal-dependent hydrolase (beta-lactamase superfamily II)